MGNKDKGSLFNRIAPLYGKFYNYQKLRFSDVIHRATGKFDLAAYATVLDVGCGTGALCAVLRKKGLQVTGMDPAERMLDVARRNGEKSGITFVLGNAVEGMPFADNAFDLSIASYVAHGLGPDERKRMYMEMARVSKHKVVIYDYNNKRSWATSFVEWLEGGDYFRFIEVVEDELRECFSEVQVVDVDPQAAWYICTPGTRRD